MKFFNECGHWSICEPDAGLGNVRYHLCITLFTKGWKDFLPPTTVLKPHLDPSWADSVLHSIRRQFRASLTPRFKMTPIALVSGSSPMSMYQPIHFPQALNSEVSFSMSMLTMHFGTVVRLGMIPFSLQWSEFSCRFRL